MCFAHIGCPYYRFGQNGPKIIAINVISPFAYTVFVLVTKTGVHAIRENIDDCVKGFNVLGIT